MKHLSSHRSKKPIWILYVLAAVAVIIAGFAVYKVIISQESDQPAIEDDQDPTGDNTADGTDDQDPTDNDIDTPVEPEPEVSDAEIEQLLAEADTLAAGYFYDEALTLLTGNEDSRVTAKIAEVQAQKDNLVKYEGQTYHVFFHSLIVDNSKAFDGDYDSAGYNLYMTTVSEFEKMLPLFLENDFVLYDITEMVELVDGVAVPKDIMLPPGKKPLVISIDDVNYYKYMEEDGFADRLDVDENGRVVTVVLDENGEDTFTYDGDVMPILDTFVMEHPEFSYRGAKGIVAITGYEGAYGYMITDLPDFDEATQQWMLDKVVEVSDALRASGWQIANHSYTHNGYWSDKTMTMDQLEYDTGRWLGEIMPYVGETNIIITPFGVVYDKDDERYRYIIDNGFYIYCPVGSRMTTLYRDDNMLQERLNLDGLTMIKYPERISKHFFDPALVLDPERPPMD